MSRPTADLCAVYMCANGRTAYVCPEGHWYWLTLQEAASWTVCPHCVGWWDLGA